MRQSRPAHGEIARPRNQDAVALSVTREPPLAAIGIDSLVMTELSGAKGSSSARAFDSLTWSACTPYRI